MSCEERERLENAYRLAVREFQESVVRMSKLMSDTMARQFHEAHAKSEELRIGCESRRQALDAHRQEHGC